MPRSAPDVLLPLLALPFLAVRAHAGEEPPQTVEERLAALEEDNRRMRAELDALAGDFAGLDLREVLPVLPEQGYNGLGLAASKVYGGQGLSIGGYGEGVYTNQAGSGDQFDLLRAVLYFGYKFNDEWVFNSEIEIEHADEVFVEFAYVDRLIDEAVNARIGLVLIPMGFLSELHEPTTYLAVNRPETERRILPSTWRENGIGVYGDAGPVSYRAYVVNGFDATGFDASGLRGGRQKGSQALADDLAFVTRVDWTETPGLLAGGSFYYGGAGQDQAGLGSTPVMIHDLHADWKWRGLWLRGLYAHAEIDDVTALNNALGFVGNQSVGEELEGKYVEAGYDVLSALAPGSRQSLYPFVRFEWIDTQAEVPSGFASDPANDDDITTFGLHYKPISNLVFKLDYDDFDRGTDRWNLSFGYVF